METKRTAIAILWTLALLSSACSRSEVEPRCLGLLRVQPENRAGVFLNEDLVFTFSAPIDPNSITDHSVRIVDDVGRPAGGHWLVRGSTLRFQPDPVLDRSVADGGYRPGGRYTVRLLGFPVLSGIRDTHGAPLEMTLPWAFETVDPRSQEGGVVFDDASPAKCYPLVTTSWLDLELDPRGQELLLEPTGAILLCCGEPLDPSTLDSDDFELFRTPERHAAGELPERIPLRARLIHNFDEGEIPASSELRAMVSRLERLSERNPEPGLAVVELMPERILEPGNSYGFRLGPAPRLRDFGGNLAWNVGTNRETQEIEVDRERVPEVAGSVTLEFLDGERFIPIPIPIPGVDGTAHWGASGRVDVRYPAAAGSGEAGSVSLSGALEERDLHATRLEVPEGATCRLPEVPGLCVLRSQGRMWIGGDLRRASARGLGEGEQYENLHHQSLSRTDLSQWLNSKLDSTDEWTVLIAGGDLVIDGSIDVETPLLLVAGGRIRAVGEVRAPELAQWLLGSGGSLDLEPTTSTPNFVLDPPMKNPLRESLFFAAVSSQVPAFAADLRWGTPVVRGHAGDGAFRVRYLPPSGPVDLALAVEHPRLLENEGPVRLLIEFEMPPHDPSTHTWDPPWIDSVKLSWERLNSPGDR